MQEQRMIIFDDFFEFENYINNIKVRTEEKIIENELIWNQYDNGTKEEYIEKIKNLVFLTIKNNQKMFSDCLFLLKCHKHQEFELIKISYILNLTDVYVKNIESCDEENLEKKMKNKINKEEIFNQIKQNGCKCYLYGNKNNSLTQSDLIKTIENNKERIINGKIGNSFADVIQDKNNE